MVLINSKNSENGIEEKDVWMRNKLNSCLYAIKSKIYLIYCRISDDLWLEQGGEKQVAKNIAIKVARAEKDMTQKALAEAVGVSRQTMNAIEKGEYNPTIKLCRKICRVLNKSLDDLFWEDEEDEEREE